MNSPTRLILTRHGQAHCNVHGIIGGPRGCTGLTNHGRHQAQQLAHRLRTDHTQTPITAAYTTPLRRARETADIVANHLDLPITTMDDLREPDYGQADGKPWTDVITAFGRIPAQHPDHPIAPGAEPWTTYLQRTTTALRDTLTRHPGGTVLIIAHGETVTAAAHLFLNLTTSLRANAAFAVHYASITRWEQQPLAWTQPNAGWRWTLLTHNDTAHLTP
jgi:2,3-bisphosphoglycerate-dependent phosphoglycerate mutase